MNKNKLACYLLVLLGLMVMFGAAYVIISYAQGVIGAIVEFVTTNDFTKLQQCGVNPPAEFSKLKSDFATLILPALYLGIPVLLLVISALMFLAGFYFHKGKMEDDSQKQEQLERDMVHKVVQKMEKERQGGPAQRPASMRAMEEPEEGPEEEPEEEAEAEPEEEEPPKKQSRFKLFTKKKKK